MENVKKPQSVVASKTMGNQSHRAQTNQPGCRDSNKLWDFFCSVKLAVVIILVMVVACILGTVVVQEKTMDEYTARYGYGLATFLKLRN